MAPGNRFIDSVFDATNGQRLREYIRKAQKPDHPLYHVLERLQAVREGVECFERVHGRFPTEREIHLARFDPATLAHVREVIEAITQARAAPKPPEFTGGYRDNPIPLARPWRPRPGVVAWLWRGAYHVFTAYDRFVRWFDSLGRKQLGP